MLKAKSLRHDRVYKDSRSSSLKASSIFVSRFPAIYNRIVMFYLEYKTKISLKEYLTLRFRQLTIRYES